MYTLRNTRKARYHWIENHVNLPCQLLVDIEKIQNFATRNFTKLKSRIEVNHMALFNMLFVSQNELIHLSQSTRSSLSTELNEWLADYSFSIVFALVNFATLPNFWKQINQEMTIEFRPNHNDEIKNQCKS